MNSLKLQTPLEEMALQIRREILDFKKRFPNVIEPGFEEFDSYTSLYLNNFLNLAVKNNGRRTLDRYFDGREDTPLKQLLDYRTDRSSEFMLSKTPKQVYADIESVLNQYWVDTQLIEDELQKSHAEKKPFPMRRIAEALLPVYIHLRALGYSKADLRT